jgi:hypothetical protein
METTMLKIKTYTDLIKKKTLEERFLYLRLDGKVGFETFGFDRYLNQKLYKSLKWKQVRDFVICRDLGYDMGLEDFPIKDRIIVHHMNPLLVSDVEKDDPKIYNPEFLICVSANTHEAIHYGNELLLPTPLIIRKKNDTCPWKN